MFGIVHYVNIAILILKVSARQKSITPIFLNEVLNNFVCYFLLRPIQKFEMTYIRKPLLRSVTFCTDFIEHSIFFVI